MRLTKNQLESIKETFRTFFQERDHIWLFGSRANSLKRGGDIDLYIETHYENTAIVAKKQIEFLSDLKKKIGDQKIDLIINILIQNKTLSIYEEARNTGVLIL
jgi:predicted nucleotidyltransferase